MLERHESDPLSLRAYERALDEENEQREWEEEEQRDKLLRGEPFFGDVDLYRDMRRGK